MNRPTTDNQLEVFDIVNAQDEIIGQATRKDCHSNLTLIHRSVGIFVFNDQGQIFLQKRSQTKDTSPGCWTDSASGHVDSGDTYLSAAVREVAEELGLHVKPNQLTKIAKNLYPVAHETEFNTQFTLHHNGPFTLHLQEIETGGWFTVDEAIAKVKDGSLPATALFKLVILDPHITNHLKKVIASL